MPQQKIPASFTTTHQELHDFHKSQAKDGGRTVNNTAALLPPKDLDEGSYTEGQIKGHLSKVAEHQEAAKSGNKIHGIDFKTGPENSALPNAKATDSRP